jgi:Uma2 family endonuclease
MGTTVDRERGPWTYRDIQERTPEDNVRREIIDGWLYIDGHPVDDPMAEVAADSANPRHQGVVIELIRFLLGYRENHAGQLFVSPMDCAFGDHILQPDVFWLDTLERVERPIDVTPALVIEISSPSTRRHDLVRKRRVYEQCQVPEYWFVDLDALRIERYHLSEAGTYGKPDIIDEGTLRSTALPGLEVPIAEILEPAIYGRE